MPTTWASKSSAAITPIFSSIVCTAWQTRNASARGVRLVEIPLEAETPPTLEQVDRWLELFDDPQNLPVLVHCEHGVVRTGMMVAVYEMEHLGQSNAGAIADLPMFGHELDVPRRKPMRDFIAGYEPRR